jgi:hypothetical protein
LTQQLAGLSVEQMHFGAGRPRYRLIFVFGNIWIVIQLVLDVEVGRRASEKEISYHYNSTSRWWKTLMQRKVGMG